FARTLDTVIRSLLQYARSTALALTRSGTRRPLFAHLWGIHVDEVPSPGGLRQALNAVADHFRASQDHGPGPGLGSYHLIEGWSAPYPETTGYIIPTLYALADRTQRPELAGRAQRAADWLLSIQRADGGWQGGRIGEERPSVVFNSAQVVRGLMAAHARTGGQGYLDAARKCCDWITGVQEADGSWARHNFLGAARVYDAYVAAPLLHMHAITGEDRYRAAAARQLEWVFTRQRPNGWFADADNTLRHNDRPITHTIAYTIDGLIESHAFLRDERSLHAAQRAADALLVVFMKKGRLAGRYDARWHGSEASIPTGCAQMAIVWSRLHAITGDIRYAEARDRMVAWLIAVQRSIMDGPVDARGALPGSVPLWGRYEKFACPNWASKYFADALLCAEGRLPAF
ncbi:MAG TPA: prenyltransferase/squalene oxidase repeat-containing protein, partial [Flavobacteriales bacterium]|nr:prenyltransferase/squalene oxidase repeat-containing protein [Flavobacteriales bacterium]